MKVRKPQLLHYDAILFDVDGTLIDSAPGILHTLEEVFQKMGVDVTGVNLRRYLGPPLRKSFGEHFTELDKIEQATRLYRESYAVKGSHECAAYPRCSGNAAAPEGRRADPVHRYFQAHRGGHPDPGRKGSCTLL